MFKHMMRGSLRASRSTTSFQNRKVSHRLVSTTSSAHKVAEASKVAILLASVASAYAFWVKANRAEQAVEALRHNEQRQGSASTLPLSETPTLNHDMSKPNVDAAYEEMLALLGSDRVDRSDMSLIAHSNTEWSPSPNGDLDRASMIVYPKSTEEVSKIARICHRRKIPMIAFSGGTSLEATLAAIHGEVCIDFKLMNKILAVRKEDVDVTVQPGVSYMDLNTQLAKEDLFFPVDPGPGAQIGGMIAQGCSGTNAYRYGTMKDWVLGLELVLADGTIVRTRHRPRKSSSGYDLTRLIIGSEGTLAFVTEASLKITKTPENVKVALLSFPRMEDAVSMAVRTLQRGIQLEAMELLDDFAMKAINIAGYTKRQWPEQPAILLKFAGTKQIVSDQVRIIRQVAAESACSDFIEAENATENEELWMARKTALFSTLAMKDDPDDDFMSADSCVPISRLAEIVKNFQGRLEERGMMGSCIAHAGDGNIHASILYKKESREVAEDIIRETQRDGIRMEGTVSGEHGIGLSFRDVLEEELGASSIDMMRQIKLALDPLCLLNPDKMIRVQSKPSSAEHKV